LRFSGAAVAGLLALSAPPGALAGDSPPPSTRPAVLDTDPAKNVPPGYHLESHARKGLLVAGGIMLGLSFGFSVAVAATKSEPAYSDHLSSNEVPYNPGSLAAPVLGPWLALSSLKSYECSSLPGLYYSPSACRNARTQAKVWEAVLIVDGLVQLSGVALIALGLVFPRQQFVINDALKAQVVPVSLGSSGHGLAVVGTFGGP
jgi:hypothetical protein